MKHQHMKVDVSTTSPILWMEVSTDDFGRLFANMAADQQVAVFAAMIEHMKPHPLQWDYIAIELERPENQRVSKNLRHMLWAEPDAALIAAEGLSE